MKKLLFSAAALLCTVAALAQTPTTPTPANKAVAATRRHDPSAKQHAADADEDGQTTRSATHGQTVSTFAQTISLTGADKGAAVSTLASEGRSSAKGQRAARADKSARGGAHGTRATGSSHATTRRAGIGSRHGR